MNMVSWYSLNQFLKMRSYIGSGLTICILLLSCNILLVKNDYFLPSELEICDGENVRSYKKKFCSGSKLVFTGNSTKLNSDCICVSGIWLIINRDCVPSVLTSRKGGCLLSPQIKAMQYLGPLGFADDFFTVITQSKRDFEYKLFRAVKNEVLVHGPVWIYNGNLSKEANNTTNSYNYCASKRVRGLRKKVMTRYTLHGKLSVQYECSRNYSVLVSPQIEYGIIDKGASECKLNCKAIPKSKIIKRNKTENQQPKKVYFPKPRRFLNQSLHRLQKVKRKVVRVNKTVQMKKENFNNTNNSTATDPEVVKAKQVKVLIRSFRDQLVRTVLAFGFDSSKKILKINETEKKMNSTEENSTEGNSTAETELKHPKSSFEIMDKLHGIVHKTCSGVVPKRYLYLAYLMFQAVYEVRGSNMLETLKEKEASKILGFLNDCYSSLQPVKMVSGCNEPTWNNNDSNSKSGFRFGYGYDRKRHLTLEIPWKMIDLTVGVCIDAFGPSYIMYHKMEQALEKLFTKELRILWKRPPERELFYTRLYGPNWKYYLDKLEGCVEAVYSRNSKLSRLRRPDEISSAKGNEDSSTTVTNSSYSYDITLAEIGKQESCPVKTCQNSKANASQLSVPG